MAGTLIGIARRPVPRAAMELLAQVTTSVEAGVEGDCKGLKFPRRQVTLLSRELWDATLYVLGNPPLEWTARRANLLVEAIDLPRGAGSVLKVGPVRLEVTAQTTPCARMDEIWPGLRRALAPDWRGGITCRVLEGGEIKLGDAVETLISLPHRTALLPG